MSDFFVPSLAECERDDRECAVLPCPPELDAEIWATFRESFPRATPAPPAYEEEGPASGGYSRRAGARGEFAHEREAA